MQIIFQKIKCALNFTLLRQNFLKKKKKGSKTEISQYVFRKFPNKNQGMREPKINCDNQIIIIIIKPDRIKKKLLGKEKRQREERRRRRHGAAQMTKGDEMKREREKDKCERES